MSIYCFYCGAENPSEAIFCVKCGKNIGNFTTGGTCPNCGTEIKKGMVYCHQCGKKIELIPYFEEFDEVNRMILSKLLENPQSKNTYLKGYLKSKGVNITLEEVADRRSVVEEKLVQEMHFPSKKERIPIPSGNARTIGWIGIVFALLSLIAFAIPFMIIAVILGAIAWSRGEEGLGQAAICLGLVLGLLSFAIGMPYVEWPEPY